MLYERVIRMHVYVGIVLRKCTYVCQHVRVFVHVCRYVRMCVRYIYVHVLCYFNVSSFEQLVKSNPHLPVILFSRNKRERRQDKEARETKEREREL